MGLLAGIGDPEKSGDSETGTSTDVVKRRRLALTEFAKEDVALKKAHEYWSEKRKDGLLPARRDIDIVDLRPLMGFMHMLDVVDAKAGQFKFRLHGTRVRIGASFSNDVVSNITSKAMRDAAVEDYQSVCFTGVPCYQHIVALVDFVQYSYSRLILPLASDGRTVDALLICINARKFPDFKV